MFVYQNRECGNVHITLRDALEEAREMYDFGDDCNCVTFDEYYAILEVK